MRAPSLAIASSFFLAIPYLTACEHVVIETDDPEVSVVTSALEVGPAATYLIDNGNDDHESNSPDVSSDGEWLAYVAKPREGGGPILVVRDIGHQAIDSEHRLVRGTDEEIYGAEPVNADAAIDDPKIARGGRYVTFVSRATNLVPGDTANHQDVFLYDRSLGTTTLVSRTSAGVPGNGDSTDAVISDDGRRVAFTSTASNLVAGDTNELEDIFVFDANANTLRRVSLSTGGGQLLGWTYGHPDLTPDGRYVTYLRVPVNGGNRQIARYDYTTQTTSVLIAQGQTWPASGGYTPVIGALSADVMLRDGVLFFSAPVPDHVLTDCSRPLAGTCSAAHGSHQCIAKVLATGTYEPISVPRPTGSETSFAQLLPNDQCVSLQDVSGTGRYVLFQSSASNLDPYDVNQQRDLFRYDRQDRVLERINENSAGENANGFPLSASISNDGRFVAYHASSTNLVEDDPSSSWNVFLYDRGAYGGDRWTTAYGTQSAPAFTVDRNPRMLADVDADGKHDVVAFTDNDAYISYAEVLPFYAPRFRGPYVASSSFGYNDGYRVDRHPRMTGDVNGDGRADIVGFHDDGVMVARAPSSGFAFSGPTRWVDAFGYVAGSWRVDRHPRLLADMNGDGRDDVVGFGNGGVTVALSTGTSFSAPVRWISRFGYDQGWRLSTHPRLVGDVDGDGRADVVGFFDDGVKYALSTGTGFGPYVSAMTSFASSGWTADHPRFLADVDADGDQDIVGFGGSNVWVARWNGSTASFDAASRWASYSFTYDAGWRASHPRFVTDINGDGRADLVGIGTNRVSALVSNGSAFVESDTHHSVPFTGYTTVANWTQANSVRLMADVTGDGTADVVGFGQIATYVRDFDAR